MKKYIFFLLLFGFSTSVFSQTVPSNTRLFQVNTVKGSALSLVETTDNFVYHVGTVNSSEVGFDGLAATSVGFDDLFILKSSAANGSNLWFKTFNAGNKGTIAPRYISVDSNENLYVFGQFSGTISVANQTITATPASSSFLMKINSAGNAVWINLISGGNNSLYPKIKCVTDGTDTFLIHNQTHLLRFNDSTGALIYDNVYSGVELKSVALKNSSLYIAGASLGNYTFGTVYIPGESTGFVVKGDKNANFSKSATAAVNPELSGVRGTDMSDIAFNSEGNLLITGFSVSSTNIVTDSGTFAYTFNPNTNFALNRVYYYVAKIDANLNNVSFVKTSTPVSSDAAYGIVTRSISASLVPYGNGGNFRMILKNNYFNGRNSVSAFTNPNETTSTITNMLGSSVYNLLLSFNSAGNYLAGNQQFTNSYMSVSGNSFATAATATRNFSSSLFDAVSGGTKWSKSKSNSIGGKITRPYSRHLNTATNDLFVTALVEGNANFFGRPSNLSTGMTARLIARLGQDGLPKWTAQFGLDSGKDELNVSNDFVSTDLEDNFIFLANTFGSSSTFTDGLSNVTTFSDPNQYGSKVIIKVDKYGNKVWSKQLLPSSLATVSAAVRTDTWGSVHVLGTTTKNLTVDGTTIQASGSSTIFILKFSSEGNLLYAKSYQNLGAYSLNPVFDADHNLYVFSEPISYQGGDYNFDGITIPGNTTNNADHLMLKFNSSGNVVWGKNFYFNGDSNNFDYSWPNDVQFDGTNFILMGNYNTQRPTSDYVGLDMVTIPRVYPTGTFIPFLAKINTSGSVIWQQPLHINFSMTSNYTNIEVDQDKNIYMSWYVKDKLTYKGAEYSFDAAAGNKILTKFDTQGNIKYNKIFDIYNSSYPMVDVMANDKVNISGLTTSTSILNYPINYNRASSMYIATFGELDSYYMTPAKDYLQLNSLDIANNPDNNNTFSFDLLNNVSWTASSDQAWLNLSFLSLTEKNNFKNSISGNGDAKIILSANTNETGANRTSNVMISGTGVSSKTIAVTQSGLLASGETKTFVTTLYPNPTSDILNIETQQKISKIEIFDLSGKLVKSVDGKAKNVSVSNLTNGMYLIKLYTENGVVNSKFIKN
ncbi:MAG: T9SS type A sorting domain-containing protein [Kaistella sp.]